MVIKTLDPDQMRYGSETLVTRHVKRNLQKSTYITFRYRYPYLPVPPPPTFSKKTHGPDLNYRVPRIRTFHFLESKPDLNSPSTRLKWNYKLFQSKFVAVSSRKIWLAALISLKYVLYKNMSTIVFRDYDTAIHRSNKLNFSKKNVHVIVTQRNEVWKTMRFVTKSRQKEGQYSNQAAQYLTPTVCYCNSERRGKIWNRALIRSSYTEKPGPSC